MIRLPASVLSLGPRDLVDYDNRRKHRELENIRQHISRFEVGVEEGPKFGCYRKTQPTLGAEQSFNACEIFTSDDFRSPCATPFDQSFAGDGFEEPSYPIFAGHDSSEGLRVASLENVSQVSVEIQQPSSSPPKDGFHYGGFISAPCRSSPFAPEDISTPQNLLPPGGQEYRARTLPRSPLYLSHNASSSPDRRPTSSLTPRVASHVANHNAPGVIFASPARRPATFRHQTNSFSFESFDSTERSGAAYAQDRISSLSTTDTTPRPSHDLRLRDELRGSSLASSRASDLIFSSPQLPPPFSTTSRNVSNAESLTASPARSPDNRLNGMDGYEMPVRSPSRSPQRSPDSIRSTRMNDYEMVIQSPDPRNPPTELITYETPARGSPTSPDRTSDSVRSIRTNDYSPASRSNRLSDYLRSGAARIVSYYRPRSPSTPVRHLAIYNDALPPHRQPQTPAQLPEARHQSRYHPAYTAPITRGTGRPSISTTPSRRTRGGASPLGLQNAGFRGLYGGRENGDEEQSWVDGVRFSNAEVRLWGLRDSGDDGRTLRDTPRREEWRVGRH